MAGELSLLPAAPRADLPGLPALVRCSTYLQGMDVVQAIAALPRVKDNTNSPFFQAGKASGGWVAVEWGVVAGWLGGMAFPPQFYYVSRLFLATAAAAAAAAVDSNR